MSREFSVGSDRRISDLLQEWDRSLWADPRLRAKAVAQAQQNNSVLRSGASRGELDRAELRLGVALPPSYRAFLSISNGAYADPHGLSIERDRSRRTHSSVSGAGFLPVEDLVRLTDALPVEMSSYLVDDQNSGPLIRDGEAVEDLTPLERGDSILVTSARGPEFSALVRVDEADQEWHLWVFDRDEIRGFHSFRAWLQHQLHVPSIEQIMQLIVWVREGDPRGNDLYRVAGPDSVPYLAAALDEFEDDRRVVSAVLSALGSSRSNRAVARLDRFLNENHNEALRTLAIRALVRLGSQRARDVLARVDAWEQLAELADPRGVELAVAALERGVAHASRTLERHPEPRFIPALLLAANHASTATARLQLAAALFACGAREGRAMLEEIAADSSNRWSRQASAILDGSDTAPTAGSAAD